MYNHIHVYTNIEKRYIELHTCVQLKTLMNVQSELLHIPSSKSNLQGEFSKGGS